jgi:hypothetical protein
MFKARTNTKRKKGLGVQSEDKHKEKEGGAR